LCFCAAVNIDGTQAKPLPRKGKADAWSLDPRIDKTMQCGKTVYKGKKVKRGRKTVTYGLDLGHMVRRLDPVWGKSYKLANDDTFHFTNACPQHKDLNRKVWGKLEKYILEQHVLKEGDDNVPKVTVFTGPVLKAGDPPYRGVQLPQEYWKVAVMIDPDTGKLHATAYLLSQADMVTGFEFAFGEFETYQISVARLERLTNLDFGSLRDFDPMATSRTGDGLESAGGDFARIGGPKDLVV
jgi:endonuclease G